MVADVRMKIRQRLDIFIDRLNAAISRDAESMAEVAKARTDYPTAERLKARMRALTVAQFPGCKITFTLQALMIYLPERYPLHHISIDAPLPPLMVECFSPKGLSNKPF